MTRSTQRGDASADPKQSNVQLSNVQLANVQMMAATSRHRDLAGDLHENASARFGRRRDWTAGEMAVQGNFGHHANFSSQQGLVRLVGHLAGR